LLLGLTLLLGLLLLLPLSHGVLKLRQRVRERLRGDLGVGPDEIQGLPLHLRSAGVEGLPRLGNFRCCRPCCHSTRQGI